jgi:phospholipid-binding lipoprotein MlaA
MFRIVKDPSGGQRRGDIRKAPMVTIRATGMAVAAALVLAGCATVTTPTKGDPLEGLNRTVFTLNDKVDQYGLKPVAQAYVWALPQPIRDSVTNFFSNIGDVYTAANDLLQLKITDGVEDVMRVAINTVFGVGGLFDVATLARLPKHTADFGLTLGHYGVPPGPYLVLPLLGSSTVRDTAGMLVEFEGDLTTFVQPVWVRTTLYGVRVVSLRASLLGAGDLLAGAALDKYSFVRDAYLQRRQYLISDGNPAPPVYKDDSGSDADSSGISAPASGAAGQSSTVVPAPVAASAPGSASGAAGSTVPGLQMTPGRYYSLPNPLPR